MSIGEPFTHQTAHKVYEQLMLGVLLLDGKRFKGLLYIFHIGIKDTYWLEEAGQQGGLHLWVLQAENELLELHLIEPLPGCADPTPEGTPEIMEMLDSRGSPSLGPTVWPGLVWSQSSVRTHTDTCTQSCVLFCYASQLQWSQAQFGVSGSHGVEPKFETEFTSNSIKKKNIHFLFLTVWH